MLKITFVLCLLAACCHHSTCQRESEEETDETQPWDLSWFPHSPGIPDNLAEDVKSNGTGVQLDGSGRVKMGVTSAECDDANTNLTIDYDPNDVSHHIYYICVDDEAKFVPSYKTEPWWNETTIPPAYSAIHRCMNTTIDYEERIPSFGTHRPLWAKFGEYKFLPPQRWVHNLEHGTVVMLYHPCANKQLVDQLKKIVINCLYRHIITPSQLLLPERPLALVTWGKTLEMSTIHPQLVTKFIQSTALHGPEQTYNNGQYEHELLAPALSVSGLGDTNLCPGQLF